MAIRNPDRFVRDQGSSGGGGNVTIVNPLPVPVAETRIQEVLDALNNIKIDADSVDLNTDQLEALVQAVTDAINAEPVVSGKDFFNAKHPLFTSVTGKLQVESNGQDMATEATLAEIGADIDTIETNLDTQLSTRASEASLLPVTNRFSPSVGTVSADLPYSTIGDKTLYTPASGNRVRLKWVGASSYVTQAAVPIKFKFGSGDYFWDWLLFGAFAHSDVREGDVDEPLYIHIGVNGSPVYAALDVEEF